MTIVEFRARLAYAAFVQQTTDVSTATALAVAWGQLPLSFSRTLARGSRPRRTLTPSAARTRRRSRVGTSAIVLATLPQPANTHARQGSPAP